jgi:hypothetical protein
MKLSFGGQDDRRPLLEALSGLEQPDGWPHFPHVYEYARCCAEDRRIEIEPLDADAEHS